MMNAIKSSWRLARKDLKILFKDRGQVVVLFALPLLIALLLGAPTATQRDPVTPGGESRLSIRTYVVNQDEGPYGAQVVEVLGDIQPLRLINSRTVDRADIKVADGDAPVAIIIPADFSARIDANQPTRIQLIKDPAQQAAAAAVAGILNDVLTELSVRAEIEYGIRAVYAKTGVLETADAEAVRAAQAQTMGSIWTAVQEMRLNPAIAVLREDLVGEATSLTVSGAVFAYYMPMFSSMFAFFLVGFMGESILREKEAGSFRRLLAAPIHRGTVIAGKMLAFVGVVFLQMLLLFGIGNLAFQMPLGKSPLGILALTLALALAATGLGMVVGSVARTGKQAGNIGMLLGFVLFLTSGSMAGGSITIEGGTAAVNFGSEGLRFYLSQLTPHTHAHSAYTKLMLGGAGLADVAPSIGALLGFAAIFFLVAVWRFRFD
jgi:ABC-2 type transport system permease protein